MKNKRMTRAQRLEHCKRIVAIPWPEEGSANYKAEQDEYFAATRMTGDPETLDLFPRPRRVAWQTLLARKKKLSPQEASSAPPQLFNYVAGQLLDKESDIGWRAEQQAAVSSLRHSSFSQAPDLTGTWALQVPQSSAVALGHWFGGVQARRTKPKDGMVILPASGVELQGYQGYDGLAKANHNQKLVTLVVSHGVELEAAKAEITGFGETVDCVEQFAQSVTRCSQIKVVRGHFLDQESKVAKRAALMAGFGKHTDKAEEIDKKQADETTGFRNVSILFTMIVRLAGGKGGPSAFQVLGCEVAHIDQVGEARMFPSACVHETKVLGGYKVAFFLGFSTPLMGEERFARVWRVCEPMKSWSAAVHL